MKSSRLSALARPAATSDASQAASRQTDRSDPRTPLDVRVRDRVWWSDVDKMGVMYFGRYVRFAEMAETEFFRALGYPYDAIHDQFKMWLARVHLDIDFRAPAKLDDALVCRAELAKIGASSMTFRFPVERESDGLRLADIGLVIACLDAATLKLIRTPAALRAALRPHLTLPAQDHP
jgi:acyl-CoA thioester hydrolase